MSKVRMNIEVSQDVASFLEELALSESTTKTEIVRRALSVLKAYKQQKSKGRGHLGFTADPDKLDAELVGILDS
jgi:predicted transcriptional regulator